MYSVVDYRWTVSHTVGAEGSVEGREAAVARVAVIFLHTLASILAARAVARAVTRAAGLHSWSHLGSLLQVKGHAVHPERADASEKSPLPS